jgi:hypothetical protein
VPIYLLQQTQVNNVITDPSWMTCQQTKLNRTDVVEYRDNIFIPRMLGCDRRVQEYLGDNMEVIIPPELSDGKRLE